MVIPCYNHAESLPKVVSEIHAIVPSLPILIVDDGSTPAVPSIPGAEVVRHPKNQGKGAAILTGVRHFEDRDFVLLMDADDQHPIEIIPDLLKAFHGPPTAFVVTASRNVFRDPKIPLRHRIANIILAIEFALLYGVWVPDVTNGQRVIRTRSFLSSGIRFAGFELEIETLRAAVEHGGLIRSVPTQGVRYHATSGVGRGIRITSSLFIFMLGARLMKGANADNLPRH